MIDTIISGEGGGGGGTQQSFIRGSSASNSNPFFVTLWLAFVTEKGTPFLYPLLTDGTPFALLV